MREPYITSHIYIPDSVLRASGQPQRSANTEIINLHIDDVNDPNTTMII